MKARVEIKLNERGLGEVKVNGHDVAAGVGELNVHGTAGHPPEVVLHIGALPLASLEADGARVEIEAHTASLLRELGWTPPPDDGGAS